MSKILKVECVEVNVPLAKPLPVGTTVVTHRGYAIVKVTTQSGVEGVGYCYTRSMPIASIINSALGPEVIGKDTDFPERIRQHLLAKFWHSAEHGTFTAALSALHSTQATNGPEVLMPGELEFRTKNLREITGIHLSRGVQENIRKVASELRVVIPEFDL